MTLIKFKNEATDKYVEKTPYFSYLFNDFFDGMLTSDFRKTSTPSVNVQEDDASFKLEVAAPGLSKEDFKISVDKNMISIRAERKNEANEASSRYTRKEFSYTSFKRSFNLPETVDADNILANYENGIMTITLPKREEAKPKPARDIKVA